jgi:hypothetical protein
MAQPISEEMQAHIKKRYVPYVFGSKQVAKELGISHKTVLRYASQEAREADRAASRAYKQRTTGTCERCGGETRYNGRSVNGPSRICSACAHTFTHCARGHEYTPETDLRGRDRAWTCRICRNAYMREYSAKRRREAGVPQRDPAGYESRRLNLESEGAPK